MNASLAIGAVAALAVVAVGMKINDTVNADRTTVDAIFKDAGGVAPGYEVRADGVVVGSVTAMHVAADHQADLTMSLDKAALPLHKDATARIRPQNLLGELYIEFNPGTPNSPVVSSDAVIPVSQTSTSVSLQDVLNTLNDPTSTGLAALVTALGEGVQGNGANLASAITTLRPALTQAQELGRLLDSQNAILTQLVDRVDPVADALADDHGQTLDRLVGSTNQTLRTVAQNHDALDSALGDLPGTVSSARRTLTQLSGVAQQATPALRSIRPLTDNLGTVSDELQNFSDAATPALDSLEPVLDDAAPLLEQARPIVGRLQQSGHNLRDATKEIAPVADQLLDRNLYGVMQFVTQWSLSTNGRDGLSNYFRGTLHMTPRTLGEFLAGAGLPSGPIGRTPLPSLPGVTSAPPGSGAAPTPNLLLPSSAQSTNKKDPDDGGLTGLSSKQEHSIADQLFGGN